MSKLQKFITILAFLWGFLAVGASATGLTWGTEACGLLVLLGGGFAIFISAMIVWSP